MLTLVSSLRSSLRLSQLYSFLSSGEDENLGYIPFPRLIDDPTGISYFPRQRRLVVFSEGGDEIVFVDPFNRSVERRISAEDTRPRYPSILSPQINTVFYVGEGGIDNDGLFSVDIAGNISTVASIGGNDVGKVTDAVFNPNDSSIIFLDESKGQLHRINSTGDLQLNHIRVQKRSQDLPQIDIDRVTNTLFLRDTDRNAIHVIKSNGDQELLSLGFQPLGMSWSSDENLLYVFGIIVSQIAVFQWNGGLLEEISALSPSFPGVVIGADYDPIRKSVVLKMNSSLLGKDGLLYLNKDNLEGFVYAEYDYNTPFAFVPDQSSFYIPLKSINSIRGYKALQTTSAIKRAPFSYDKLIPINFMGRRGVFAYNSKKATIYNEVFNVRNIELVFSSLFSPISSLDNLIYANFLDLVDEEVLLLAFDNGEILLVNEQFSVVKSLSSSDLTISREGNQFLINPGVDGPYQVVGTKFTSSFRFLYVAFSNGKVGDDNPRGVVVCYDLTLGLSDATPIGFSEAPGEVSQITSIELNSISNHLLVLGDASNNTILRILDAIPASGRMSLLASKTSDLDTSEMTLFEDRAVYGSLSGQLYSIGTSVTSDLRELSLTSVSQVTASGANRFIYALDSSNNYLHTLNSKIEPYGSVIFKESPTSATTYGNFIYVNVQGSEISLPTLSNNLSVGVPINRLDFSQSIGVDINIGDIITLTQGSDTFFLTSLSQIEASKTFIFINSFTPPVEISNTDSTTSVTGDLIYQISQTALLAELRDSQIDFKVERTVGQSYDTYYASTFSPYFLINSLEENTFQSIEGLETPLGSRLNRKIEAPYYSKENFIYFQVDSDEIFRMNLLDRSVQAVQLLEAPDLNRLNNILIINDIFLLTLNDQTVLYKFSLTESRIDRQSFSYYEELDLGNIPNKMVYNEIEGVVNIYSDSKLQKIVI